MELKLRSVFGVSFTFSSLNRTFYGIETRGRMLTGVTSFAVLIVPFMELKQERSISNFRFKARLNRTFYGIETDIISALRSLKEAS